MQKPNNALAILVLSFGLLSCTACSKETLIIQDFEQGLMHDEGGIYKVYDAGSKFEYSNNGVCTYDHKDYPCMWFGFQFKTSNNINKLILDCDSILSEPSNIGNYEGVKATNTNKYHMEVSLERKSGWFSNPQYMISNPVDHNNKIHHVSTSCAYKGKAILKSNFEIHFSD